MSNGPGKMTDHHRKPSSIGGKRAENNMSRVSRRKHRAWHLLFSNLPAPDILERFKKLLEIYNVNTPDEEGDSYTLIITQMTDNVVKTGSELEPLVLEDLPEEEDYPLLEVQEVTPELAQKLALTPEERQLINYCLKGDDLGN